MSKGCEQADLPGEEHGHQSWSQSSLLGRLSWSRVWKEGALGLAAFGAHEPLCGCRPGHSLLERQVPLAPGTVPGASAAGTAHRLCPRIAPPRGEPALLPSVHCAVQSEGCAWQRPAGGLRREQAVSEGTGGCALAAAVRLTRPRAPPGATPARGCCEQTLRCLLGKV